MKLLRACLVVVLLAWLASAAMLARQSLTNPPLAVGPLPYREVHPDLSADGSVLVCEIVATPQGTVALERAGSGQVSSILVVDRATDRVEVVPRGANGSSYTPRISGDGQKLVFVSEASNLVSGDRNACADAFLYNRATRTLERLPVARDKTGECSSFEPSISLHGELIAYSTYGNPERERKITLLDATRQHLTALPTLGPDFGRAAMSPDLASVAYATFDQRPGNPSVDICLFEVERQGAKLSVSVPECLTQQANGPSYEPCLANDWCAFSSRASNLVPHDENGHFDVFMLDLNTRQVQRVDGPGGEPDDASFEPSLSSDGNRLVFTSYAGNLVAGDQNGTSDVFLFERETRRLRLLSRTAQGWPGNGPSYSPTISGDGQTVVFFTRATDLGAEPVAPGQLYLWTEAGLTRQSLPP